MGGKFMEDYVGVCLNCGDVDFDTERCLLCGGTFVKTNIKKENYIDAINVWDEDIIDRYLVWRYINKIDDPDISRVELENMWICPRCGDMLSEANTKNCIYCGCTMVPTKYTIEYILKMTEKDYPKFMKKIFNEYCYHNPLFDKIEFHRRRIENGEESDPKKELAEMISEANKKSSWGLAMDPMELAGYCTTFDDNDD